MISTPRTVSLPPGALSFQSVTLLPSMPGDRERNAFRLDVDYGNGKVMRNWVLNAGSLKEALEEAEAFGRQITPSHPFHAFNAKHQERGTYFRFGILPGKNGGHLVTMFKPGSHKFDLQPVFKSSPTVEISQATLLRLKQLALSLRGELDAAELEEIPEDGEVDLEENENVEEGRRLERSGDHSPNPERTGSGSSSLASSTESLPRTRELADHRQPGGLLDPDVFKERSSTNTRLLIPKTHSPHKKKKKSEKEKNLRKSHPATETKSPPNRKSWFLIPDKGGDRSTLWSSRGK